MDRLLQDRKFPLMPHALLLLTFPFVYDTGVSGTKEIRISYCKRPKKAVIRADKKPQVLGTFKKLFAMLPPGLRLDSELLFI